jgi:multimeric flavodoxin WrbA
MADQIGIEDLKVKILGISASARYGNTELAIREALKAAEVEPFVAETDYIHLGELNLVPCKGCFKCWGWRAPSEDEEFECYESHDDSAAVIKRMKGADGIILGTPIYHGQKSSLLAILMEKCHCFGFLSYTRNAGKLMHKSLGAIEVGNTDWGGHATVYTEIITWGIQMGMWPAYWNGNYYGDTQPHRGGMCATLDARCEFDGDAILKESSRYIPPLMGSRNMRGVRNMGRATAISALHAKAGLIQVAREGVELPEIIPFKEYNVIPEKGSYLDKLVLEGKLKLTAEACAPGNVDIASG